MHKVTLSRQACDDRLAAERCRGERARMRWREGAELAVAWAREQASRAVTETERARSLAARGNRVTARTRAAAEGAAPGRYTEARRKVPNGERDVHARQCGGHVTVRASSVSQYPEPRDGSGHYQ